MVEEHFAKRITEKHRLPLDAVVKQAIKWLEIDMDLDEVEFVLANFMFRSRATTYYVRGYISHSERILVLSKKELFPMGGVVK